jgi:hypothetical protein
MGEKQEVGKEWEGRKGRNGRGRDERRRRWEGERRKGGGKEEERRRG